jgi:preprotein translocase subunit YajC
MISKYLLLVLHNFLFLFLIIISNLEHNKKFDEMKIKNVIEKSNKGKKVYICGGKYALTTITR